MYKNNSAPFIETYTALLEKVKAHTTPIYFAKGQVVAVKKIKSSCH